MNPTQITVIDGCAVPVDLYNQARERAISTHTTQCIGVIYDAAPAPPASDAAEVLRSILTPPPFFTDLRVGNHCRYLMGCTRDELRSCGCAMILYITRHAEEVSE